MRRLGGALADLKADLGRDTDAADPASPADPARPGVA